MTVLKQLKEPRRTEWHCPKCKEAITAEMTHAIPSQIEAEWEAFLATVQNEAVRHRCKS